MNISFDDVINVPLTIGGITRPFFIRQHSLGDQGVVRQVFVEHQYEAGDGPHSQALERAAGGMRSRGKIPFILDLGANIGASATFFAFRYPEAHVLAVEPHPANFSLLEKNTTGLAVTCLQAAVGRNNKSVALLDPGMGDWGYRTGPVHGEVASGTFSAELTVPCRTPDSLFSELPLDVEPLLCKIDIEGAEAELFFEGADWARRFFTIVIELHDWMLPAKRSSRPFLQWLARSDMEIFPKGENLFCFNVDRLGPWL